jgi:hypothetical protein
MPQKFTMKSGSVLEVSPAPMEKAFRVAQVLMDLKSTMDKDLPPDQASLWLASKPALREAIRDCFEWATYNGERLSDSLGDDAKWGAGFRRDYMGIIETVMEVNAVPFFDRPPSGSSLPTETATAVRGR